MLDPLRIHFRRFLGNPKRSQKLQHQSVSSARRLRDFLPLVGQKDAPIRLRSHQTLALEPLDRFGNGDVRHSQSLRQIHRPRLPRFADQRVDQLDIVLGVFAAMVLPSPREAVRSLQSGWIIA